MLIISKTRSNKKKIGWDVTFLVLILLKFLKLLVSLSQFGNYSTISEIKKKLCVKLNPDQTSKCEQTRMNNLLE